MPRVFDQNLYEAFVSSNPNFIDADGQQASIPHGLDARPVPLAEGLPSNPLSEFLRSLGGIFGIEGNRPMDGQSGGPSLFEAGPTLASKQTLRNLEAFVDTCSAAASPMDFVRGHLVSGLLDLAEEHGGSAGGSIEGTSAFSILGVHAGINWQYFAPSPSDPTQTYTLAFFGFSTTKNFQREQVIQGSGKALGVLGVMGSGGLGLNLAKAHQQNTPEAWSGYFDTISGGWPAPFPVPSGASLFWSRNEHGLVFTGAEISWGGGVGAAWTHPHFKQIWGQIRADRPTVEALGKGMLTQLPIEGKRPDLVQS